MTKFSVNLNKFALLRNSRGGNLPDLGTIARRCIARGVDGITLHPRPDERHARATDVEMLAHLLAEQAHTAQAGSEARGMEAASPPESPRGGSGTLLGSRTSIELNVEGYPDERYLELCTRVRPHQATLVPDAPGQLTSDHGWDVPAHEGLLREAVARLHEAGIRVSLFLDPVPELAGAAARTGADRVELYTESWARAFGSKDEARVLEGFAATARAATAAGLGINAGHDLNLSNLGRFLTAVPGVAEVSIGHAFVCEAFDYTLEGAIDRYLAITARCG